ncbi:hypothetical protein AB0D14_28810 [Streptomyces sp. NPDC048484]|uniref:hypothetical protein n=1 Tax=Streptomyces sp. NPDC048484 TaxID=3155146 RepID=UPI0034321B63
MNGDEGTAQLEWWANSSTCLACIPVRIAAVPGSQAWDAVTSPALDEDEPEGIQFLLDLSPFFTLRFADNSGTEVEVEQVGDANHLRLRTTAGPNRSSRGRQ